MTKQGKDMTTRASRKKAKKASKPSVVRLVVDKSLPSGAGRVSQKSKAAQKKMRSQPKFKKSMEAVELYARAALEQLVDPQTAPLLRVCPAGTGASLLPTAVCKFQQHESVDMQLVLNSDVAGRPLLEGGRPVWDIAGGYYQVVALDDPLVPAIYPVKHTGPVSVYQTAVFTSEMLTETRCQLANTLAVNITDIVINFRHPLLYSALVFASGTADYGDFHPAGRLPSGEVYFWVDANPQFPAYVKFSGSFADTGTITETATVRLGVGRVVKGTHGAIVDSGMFDGTSLTATVGTVQPLAIQLEVTFKQSGYYAFELTGSFTVKNTTEVGAYLYVDNPVLEYRAGTSVFTRHAYNAQLLSTGRLFERVRVNGSSVLLSNLTPKMYQGGISYGYSASSDSGLWYTITGDANKTTKCNAQQYAQERWENGFYTYVKPTQYGQLVAVQSDIDGPNYCINGDFADPWGYSVCSVSPNLVTGITTARIHLTMFQALEYTTSQQVVLLAPPRMNAEVYEDVVKAMLELPAPFSCNESHITRLWASVKAAVKDAAEYLLPVAATIGRYAGTASRVLSSGSPLSAGLMLAGL